MDKASMLPKQIIRIILYSVGLGSLSAVVYFAGPFIAFGDWHPLENSAVRRIVILLLVTAAAGSPASVSSSVARLRSRSPMVSAARNRRSTTSRYSRSA